jgi:nanoRNase/pAp phosphatase (c-di-AMP/oligoRNAs hydrolase)
MKHYNITEINTILSSAKTALVVVPTLSVDSIGAGLALALSLKKKGLDAKVYTPHSTDANYSKLSGLELLTNTLSSSDLVVTLNYPLDQIDQVSYNDDGGKLNLVVKTKQSAPKIETNQIFIDNDSSSADICFMLGDESSLANSSDLTSKGNWIFISPANTQKTWAKTSIIDLDAPFSEIFTFLLPMLGLELDQDSAKDLLIGLRVATQSFSVNVSPESFEAGAVCLRATQPSESTPQNSFDQQPPIDSVEKSASFAPGTNKPNPVL